MLNDDTILACAHRCGLRVEKACRDGMTQIVREHLAEHPEDTIFGAISAAQKVWEKREVDNPADYLTPEELREFQDREDEDEVSPLADELSQFVNRMGNQRSRDALVRLILRDHPTLVQSKAELFLQFFYQLAKVTCFDARDEASVKTAGRIVEALGKYGDRLPYI